jgi:dephospho-CoA kinase
MNIGLTGGIATGKSTVAKLLMEHGASLIDLDAIAREVVHPGQPSLLRIVEQFGQAILQEDGTLDRKRLGSIIFADPAQRKALEAIIHPAIRAVMKARMDDHERRCQDKLVVVDVPLLYESGLEAYFQEIMVVYVPKEIQLQRLIQRDKLTEEEAQRRLNAQMDIEEKRNKADIVIDNSDSLIQTKQQIDRFWREKGLG